MLGHRGIATGALAATASAAAISGTVSITEANDTLSAGTALLIQGTLSQAEANDTLTASADLEIHGSLAAMEADDGASAAGALTVTASAFIIEADDAGAADATLLISAAAAMTEADDLPAAAGTVDLVGSVFAIGENDTLSGDAALGIIAAAVISEEDDTLSASALMPVFFPRRGGIDEREEFERRQRDWQEDLRRIIERSWRIANGEIDSVTFEPIPPPDHSPVIDMLLDQALAIDRRRAEGFIAEKKRLQEAEAMAILLLAA